MNLTRSDDDRESSVDARAIQCRLPLHGLGSDCVTTLDGDSVGDDLCGRRLQRAGMHIGFGCA